jgi:type VI secretion system protein ImpL
MKKVPISKPGASFADGGTAARMLGDVQAAVSRYLSTVERPSLLPRRALHQRPWFLVLGPPCSGKTALFAGSGLRVPQRYPSERDGTTSGSQSRVQWHFADEAVWVDTPGALCTDAGADEWRALAAALQIVRPKKPVDGMAVVVDVNELAGADEQSVKELGARLRRRIDEAIAAWGLEFPVYLALTHLDSLPGFRQFTADLRDEEVLGATLSARQQRLLPRRAFAEEFGLLRRSLADQRLVRLHAASDREAQASICRFVIQFESLEEKLGNLVAELFRPSGYAGRPVFSGFYFTSCERVSDGPLMEERVSGATVTNHPLNPRRVANAPVRTTVDTGGGQYRSFTVLPLLRSIMVGGGSLVRRTRRSSLRSLALSIVLSLCVASVTAALLLFMTASHRKAAATLSLVGQETALLTRPTTSLVERYQRLDALATVVDRLRAGESRVAFAGVFGFTRGTALLERLRPACLAELQRLVVAPAAAALESDLRLAAVGEALSGSGYAALYGSLKTYLCLTEAVAQRLAEVDTSRLRPFLASAVTRSLLAAPGAERLPQSAEAGVSRGLSLYLYYLKAGEVPLLQGDQQLIAAARSRLRQLPSPSALCEAVTSRLAGAAPRLTPVGLLGLNGPGLLASDVSVSSIYTPQAWPAVSAAIAEASRNPYTIDWVVDLPQDQTPAGFDRDSVREAMVSAFADEYRGAWLGLLASVRLQPLPPLEKSGPELSRLVAPGGEMEALLRVARDALSVKSLAQGAAAAALAAASSAATGAKGLAGQALSNGERAAGAAMALNRGPFAEVNMLGDTLASFLRPAPGQLVSLEGYRGRVAGLATALEGFADQGSDAAARTFRGTDGDPLLAGYQYTRSALSAMPAGLGDSLAPLLLAPFQQVGAAAGVVVGRSLNTWWQTEIVKVCDSRFAGRYPFRRGGTDASFGDVMDFFRPATGTFWEFFSRVLAPYLARTGDAWTVRSSDAMRLDLNPELLKTLNAAERIRETFFKPNGELRSISMAIAATGSATRPATLDVNGQKLTLASGGKPQSFAWPIETPTPGASLQVLAAGGQTHELAFDGPWGFLRLVQAGRVTLINPSTLAVTWQVNVQNVYLLQQQYRIEVAGADHPFAESPFEAFAMPRTLVVGQ